MKLVAKTLYGLEEVLAEELLQLGARNIEKNVRNVSFEGDLGFIYKANLCLRTAVRILMPIDEFQVSDETQLYKMIYRMEWEQYLDVDQTFAVDATLATDLFNHSQFAALKTKDAIVDYFRNKKGRRPDVDIKRPDIRINIHIQHNYCTVSLDSSGASLHQRGYKTAIHEAPINEVLASGLLLLAGWKGQMNFLDPMCGSGTLLIEAAMIAHQIPASICRTYFCFQNWNDYDDKLFEKIKASALKRVKDCNINICGADESNEAVQAALINIKNANLSEMITLKQSDFFQSQKTDEDELFILFNPPYDERISVNVTEFYKSIGDTLKTSYTNAQAWLITSNIEALKHVGLRTSRKIKAFNGNLEAKLVKYDIYKGSKKGKYHS